MFFNLSKKYLKLVRKPVFWLAFALFLLANLSLPAKAATQLRITDMDITTSDTAVILQWHTNSKTIARVEYGYSDNDYKWSAYVGDRDYNHTLTLRDLTPETLYYFRIVAIEDFVGTDSFSGSFTTRKLGIKSPAFDKKNNSPNQSYTNQTPAGQYNGSCQISFDKDFGFYGAYYNHTPDHPDMDSYSGSFTSHNIVGRENDWYDNQYFSFDRIDSSINFGDHFFPLNEGKKGDPYLFTVNWRAVLNVPTTGYYKFKVASDDDSWTLIDDSVVIDLNGLHPTRSKEKSLYLTAGYHKFEVFYADRSKDNAHFSFQSDSQLSFHPLPLDCNVSDVIRYNQWLSGQNVNFDNGNDNGNSHNNVIYTPEDNSQTSTWYDPALYACDPNRGYTPFKAVYKSNKSPAVWAILNNGKKHYITSPQAFMKYGCKWNEVKIVTESVLNRYENSRLERTPDNSAVYMLYQRPNAQWQKILLISPTVFVSYPNNYWGDIAKVDILDISAYPDVKLVKTKYNPAVYVLENYTTKRLISSAGIFFRFGYRWPEVVEISRIHMDSLIDGDLIK